MINNREVLNSMLELVIAIIVFLVLLFFPFVLAARVKYDDGMEKSLVVKSNNIKDPRYFANSFRRLIEECMKGDDINTSSLKRVKLSKEENVSIVKDGTSIENKVDNICYLTKSMQIDKIIHFSKEVYAKEDIELAPRTKIRAIAGEKSVIIGEDSKIIRWADAKDLLVLKSGSAAGANVTSEERLVIEPGCTFTRLYAPIIEVKKYIPQADKDIEEVVINKDVPVYMKIERNVKVVEAHKELKNTIITKYNLTVEPGAIVYGDIRSDGSVYIKNNAVVAGNLFADESVIIEEGAIILGVVYAGVNMYIGPNVTIGKLGRIKSALSRINMIIAEGTVIHGYVGCENRGEIVSKEQFAKEVKHMENITVNNDEIVKNKKAGLFEYIKCNITSDNYLNLDSLEHYEKIDYYAFRDSDTLTKVKLPEGALVVEESMFFGCDNLETVIIPDSVELIEHYAFFGCKKLKNVVIGESSKLKRVSDYAFAQCDSLEKIRFANLKEIGYAAFWECDSLKVVELINKEALEHCESNAFQGCSNFDVSKLGE